MKAHAVAALAPDLTRGLEEVVRRDDVRLQEALGPADAAILEMHREVAWGTLNCDDPNVSQRQRKTMGRNC